MDVNLGVNKVVNNAPYISTVREVKSQKELDLIIKCNAQWKKSAEAKMKFFKKDSDEYKIARSAKLVAQGIQNLCSKGSDYSPQSIKNKQNAVFAAYDNRGRLQGVALLSLSNVAPIDGKNILDEILVNPERIQSIGKRAPIKGTGTQLVKAVAEKVFKKGPKEDLGLIAFETAVPFYTKLGFEDMGIGGGGGPITKEMYLNRKDLEKLCQKV